MNPRITKAELEEIMACTSEEISNKMKEKSVWLVKNIKENQVSDPIKKREVEMQVISLAIADILSGISLGGGGFAQILLAGSRLSEYSDVIMSCMALAYAMCELDIVEESTQESSGRFVFNIRDLTDNKEKGVNHINKLRDYVVDLSPDCRASSSDRQEMIVWFSALIIFGIDSGYGSRDDLISAMSGFADTFYKLGYKDCEAEK